MADVEVRCARGHVVPPGRSTCPRCGRRVERPAAAEPETSSARRPVPPPPRGTASPGAGTTEGSVGGRLIPGVAVDLVVSSLRGERPVQLESGAMLDIGRDVGPLADLCTDNVSGHHARIRVDDDDVVIEDVGTDGRGSTNGTYLGGSRLPANQPVPLPDGAVVTCGTEPPLTIRVKVTRL